MKYHQSICIVFSILLPIYVHSIGQPEPSRPSLPSLREQAIIQNEWLEERLNVILPKQMKKYNIDIWMLLMQENAEDTVFWAIKDATVFGARGYNAILFYFDEVNTTKIVKENIVGNETTVYKTLCGRLFNLTNNTNKTVQVNIDEHWAFADGLHTGLYKNFITLMNEYDTNFTNRIIPNPNMTIDFLSIRSTGMLPYYKNITLIVHYIISQAFSDAVIKPSITTTDDVVWWIRDQIQALNMSIWFQPAVEIIGRNGQMDNNTILPGDLLWCDIGVASMNLKSDIQHLGYVLEKSELVVPKELATGLSKSNQLQKIFIENMKTGKTGNEVLQSVLAEMKKQGINGMIYSHAIGDWGHGPGPVIGTKYSQEPIPIFGDYKILNNTWFSCELQVTAPWGNKSVIFKLEEEIYIDENGNCNWVCDPPTDFWVIDSQLVIEQVDAWIAVGVLGGLLFLGIIVFLSYQWHKKRQRKRRSKFDYDHLHQDPRSVQ